jgi:ABC-2 type transport system ATP-binding protein
MPRGEEVAMIEARGLSKRYGERLAVDDLTFTVRPGMVTGFLGPNGSGKSTTMRLIVGLDSPSAGSVTVDGGSYRDKPTPLHEIGLLLEARAVHPGRSARNHLLALAQTQGIPASRVDEMIELAGLQEVARKRVGAFSLGMGQRLGVAQALLGDPKTLILDEPINGLDPEGIHWIRDLLKGLAAEGRTVLLSSHLMSEMALTAEHLIIIGRGRLIRDVSVADFVRESSKKLVRVRSPQAAGLREVVLGPGVAVRSDGPGLLEIEGLDAEQIGETAAKHEFVLHELSPQQASLEDAFMALTESEIEYRTADQAEAQPGSAERIAA